MNQRDEVAVDPYFREASWSHEGTQYGSENHLRTKYALAVPNEALRAASSIGDLGLFFSIGEAWSQVALHFAPRDNPAFVDVGCGCAKMGRFLMLHPSATYLGIDIFKPAIDWCQVEFGKSYADRSSFVHLDLYSALYNPQGRLDAATATLPANDACADFVICGSLFTHLLEPEMRRYLGEISRILKPGGRLLASIHNEPEAGTSISGDARRIDMTSDFFLLNCRQAGLQQHAALGNLYGQETFVLQKGSSSATVESVTSSRGRTNVLSTASAVLARIFGNTGY